MLSLDMVADVTSLLELVLVLGVVAVTYVGHIQFELFCPFLYARYHFMALKRCESFFNQFLSNFTMKYPMTHFSF